MSFLETSIKDVRQQGRHFVVGCFYFAGARFPRVKSIDFVLEIDVRPLPF